MKHIKKINEQFDSTYPYVRKDSYPTWSYSAPYIFQDVIYIMRDKAYHLRDVSGQITDGAPAYEYGMGKRKLHIKPSHDWMSIHIDMDDKNPFTISCKDRTPYQLAHEIMETIDNVM
jgi:hypothetical protein